MKLISKAQRLDNLKKQAAQDPNLSLKNTACNLVFGEGNPDAKIYFLGEAPGKFEDLTGRPFVGQAGKVLDKLLASINLKREGVFITSILWYRPPENRDPKPDEITSFEHYLNQQIAIIKPKVIVTLGRFSLNKFLPDEKISTVHGKTVHIRWKNQKITIIPMYHPAAALRRREIMQRLMKDFKIIASKVS